MRRLAVAMILCAVLPAQGQEGETIDAVDIDKLRESAGLHATVVGHVTSVGTTQDGGITFINVGLPKKQGFVGVIFRDSYAAFPDGFDHFRNARVAISGPISLFRTEQPQIKIQTPEQIRILEN